jgi:hypothetical protein
MPPPHFLLLVVLQLRGALTLKLILSNQSL